ALIVFALLIVLTIAFASAHAQLLRATRLAQNAVDAVDDSVIIGKLRPRQLFDMLRQPSLLRVAPLAQLLQDVAWLSGKIKKRWAQVYYFLMKSLSWLVFFGLPLGAIWSCAFRVAAGAWEAVAIAAATLATIPLIHVAATDIAYGLDI